MFFGNQKIQSRQPLPNQRNKNEWRANVAGFVFRLLGTFSLNSVKRKYKTVVDNTPKQLVVLWHGDRTLCLSLKRKYF